MARNEKVALHRASQEFRCVNTACLGFNKLHNTRAILADLRRIGPQVFERFSGKKDGTLWVNTARSSPPSVSTVITVDLIDELDRVVTEIERLARA